MKKDKKTNNDIQNITQKRDILAEYSPHEINKDGTTRIQTKPR